MLKLLGALLLAGGTAAIGFSAANQLGKRARALRALLGALERMEQELSFRLSPLPELFAHLAKQAVPPADGVFQYCLNGLERIGEASLEQIWREGLERTMPYLREVEQVALEELGGALGRYDAEAQRTALSRTRNVLAQELEQAREEWEKQGRMYRVLGITAGAFLVILLL